MNEKIKGLFEKEWTLSQSNKIKEIIKSFSIAEKTIFYGLFGIFALTALIMLYRVNKNFLVDIPAKGGSITEGVVGNPRFINPLIALSDTDRDITSLVYSGLVKVDSEGNIVNDLAKSYSVSNDGLTYSFTLKDNLVFQDGTKLTTDDVEFTIKKIQDQNIKSPKESLWVGVKVQKIDDKNISFTLNKPYAPFIYNTTIGILPKHLWNNVSDDAFPFSQLNIKPIGSGPYSISKVVTDSSGLPTEYNLVANKKYVSGEPYITNINIKTYSDEGALISAYNSGDVDAVNSISPENVKEIKIGSGVVLKNPLQRVFGIFFNQNQNPVLVNKEVRLALSTSINRQDLIDKVLYGYGTAIDGPLSDDKVSDDSQSQDQLITNAKKILEKGGWVMGSDGIYSKQDSKTKKSTQLSISISTSDSPELKATAEIIQQIWQKIGIKVDVKIFELGDLNQNIIKTRKYDALLFGEIIPSGSDLYPFWHSSERNNPGLNVAMYANIKSDSILESLRRTSDTHAQQDLEKKFEYQIRNDVPAVFLYAPDFIYIVPKNIHNLRISQLTTSSDRFANINSWNINTNSVWEIFK
jgi:peptide/nickel transport system substrate-binding protein